MAVDNVVFMIINGAFLCSYQSLMYVFLYNTIKWHWYGRLVNWFCHHVRAQSTIGRTTTIQSKSERWRHRLSRHQCTIHNSRDAVTVSAAVATRSRTDCSSMKGHIRLSTALVNFDVAYHLAITAWCKRQRL